MKHKRLFRMGIIVLFAMLFLSFPYAFAEEVEDYEITLSLSFGDRTGTFTGTLQNGLPEGYGVFEFHSPQGLAARYQGEFRAGEFHGQGDVFTENGNRHVGEFYNSHLHGVGRVYLDNEIWGWGTFVDGELWNGTRNLPLFGEVSVIEGRLQGIFLFFMLLFLFATAGFFLLFSSIRQFKKTVKLAAKPSSSPTNCPKCGAGNPAGERQCHSCKALLFS